MATMHDLTERYKKFAEEGGPLHGVFSVESVDAVNVRINTHDTVLCLRLVRDVTNDEAGGALAKLRDDMEADGITGTAYLDTPERFRIGKV